MRPLVILCVVVLLAAGCARPSGPAVRGGPAATAETSVVSAEISKAIGLPVYPGATPTEGGGVTVRSGSKLITAAYYKAAAPLSAVERFYASRLPRGSLKAFISQQGAGTANFVIAQSKATKQVILSVDAAGTILQLSVTTQAKR